MTLFHCAFASYYNINDIKNETHWKEVSVRENAPKYLSLISQGLYDKDLVHKYDTNYYYPSSAGEDVDVIFINSDFDFRGYEFSNVDEREAKCIAEVKDDEVVKIDTPYCGSNKIYRGRPATYVVGGIEQGVASRANLYGILVPIDEETLEYKKYDVFRALEYINDNLIRPHKTIIHLPTKLFENEVYDFYRIFGDIFYSISKKGGIIVYQDHGDGCGILMNRNSMAVLAGSNYICVGGISSDYNIKKYDSKLYLRVNPNIYALNDINLYEYIDDEKYNIFFQFSSSSITTGVIATILSENPDNQFNTYSMEQYLMDTGEKINYGLNYNLVNNGKHIVYSPDNIYYGCGISAGNLPCTTTTTTTTENPTDIITITTTIEKPITTTTTTTTTTTSTTTTTTKKTTTRTTTKKSTKKTTTTTTTKKSTKKTTTTTKKSTKKTTTTTKKSTTTSSKNVPTSTVTGKCGSGYGACKSGYCCSKYGYCGTSSEYCKSGCQPKYGLCK
ncbi:hypothetical protein BCR36DRAFT_580033 [Piromyces finnis]|uniref:Chitin-binding type-1 domain-containing protein n=1 Tax=Piromyces finnis TaxID=1754191 RepID=A0A1Y1VLP5_9FUNG|nr:hypothetical protein BCR36DRAFT_580033 [Piromyces finnis]|eukprot:ORX58407.1 hypothetical protein BCR36DRAFT_580033 [Piromyces finnis]